MPRLRKVMANLNKTMPSLGFSISDLGLGKLSLDQVMLDLKSSMLNLGETISDLGFFMLSLEQTKELPVKSKDV